MRKGVMNNTLVVAIFFYLSIIGIKLMFYAYIMVMEQ